MARLLLIEDEVDSREILELALQGAGYDVVAVPSSLAAKRALEVGAFDLVLADLMLEPQNLEDALHSVRELVELARPAPLGLLTGWPLPKQAVELLGVVFMLKKPCARDALIGQLARTLQLPAVTPSRHETLRAYFAAIQNRAYQALGELCTDDVVYQLPGVHAQLSNEIRGREAFVAFTDETFKSFREPRFELRAIRPLPNGAMVEYVGSWLDDKEPRRLPGTVMFEFRDDRIARIGVRVDPGQLG